MSSWAAARAAAQGKSLPEVVEVAQRVRLRVNLVAVLDTLHYLARSGRVPQAVDWAASLLQVKPILSLRGGEVTLLERARTLKKAISQVVEIMRQRSGHQRPLHVAVFHAHARREAEALAERVRGDFQPEELYITPFTPVMGVHTGPGVVSLAFYTGED